MGLQALVAVVRPVTRTFHYAVPERLRAWAHPGVRCLVPFGRSRVVGFILGLDEGGIPAALKDLAEILDPEPVLPPDLLRLGAWLSAYYHHPPGETLASFLPPGCRVQSRPVYRPACDAPLLEPDSTTALLWAAAKRRGGLPCASVPASRLSALNALVASGLLLREWEVTSSERPSGDVWYGLENGLQASVPLLHRSRRLAEVLRALANGPVLRRTLLAGGMSSEVLARAVKRGWVRRWEDAAETSALTVAGFGSEDKVGALTEEQARAVESIVAAFEAAEYQAFLLQGVTGSGKTEVYIRAVREARRRGFGAIVLVPEISLTPQFLGRFVKHFGAELAVLHSGLGERERRLQWEKVRSGRAPIAIGARSAVFAPVARLGIVVVDEEHEASYKQEEGLRYNAKHVALQRARLAGAVALLGSATPDLETYWGAQSGRYRRLELSHRAQTARSPTFHLVDLRQEERRRRNRVLLSAPLREHVEAALGRGEQGLLFLNRRGFSPAIVCSDCGEAVHCPRCSVSLTLHGRSGPEGGLLICHYCSVQRSVPEVCPACRSFRLSPIGAGTQRLLEAAKEAWPTARILRLDRDAGGRQAGADVLGTFHKGEADILVGTQMVAKGHHFPRLTVVGVVDADLSLNFPDFRASERTYQVLTQVAGRAGRAELPGVVIFQTRNPAHPVLEAVVRGDFGTFARMELDARREAGFPPFRRLALLGFSCPEESACRRFAGELAEEARILGRPLRVEVLGPAPAPVERVRARYRFQVLLKAPGAEPAPVQEVLRRLLARRTATPNRQVRLSVDVDPVSLL